MEIFMGLGKRNIEEQLQYFFTMGKNERRRVIEWYLRQKCPTGKQRKFIECVGNALKKIDYDYRIPILEPSVDKSRKIYYEAGQKVALGLSCKGWEKKAKRFAPEYNSRLATVDEVYLWYAYRIAMGYCSLAQMCDTVDDAKIQDPEILRIKESGYKTFAKAKDGINNTKKIVKDEYGFRLIGGAIAESKSLKSAIRNKMVKEQNIGEPQFYSVGVIVLTK